MREGTHTARTLGEQMRVAGVSALKDYFEAAEQRTAAPCVLHLSVLDLDLYAEVTLNPRNRVNDNSSHRIAPFQVLGKVEKT